MKHEMKINKQATLVQVVTTTNSNSRVTWNGEPSVEEALKKMFTDQGDLYGRVLSVSREDALEAGWHPGDAEFSSGCEGWKRMVRDEGIITKTTKTSIVTVFSILGFGT